MMHALTTSYKPPAKPVGLHSKSLSTGHAADVQRLGRARSISLHRERSAPRVMNLTLVAS